MLTPNLFDLEKSFLSIQDLIMYQISKFHVNQMLTEELTNLGM